MSYTSNGTGSLAVWARSSVFDAKLNIYAPNGSLAGSDDSNGWNQTGDINNAAVNVQLTQVGNYQIQLSSSNESYGDGNYQVFVSPGADFKLKYSVSFRPLVFGISSSNYVCIVDDGNGIWFYNIGTNVIDKSYGSSLFGGTYGGCYSKQQDRVFALVYDKVLSHDAIVEFDNTGSYIASYNTAPFFGNPTMCYDKFNDRIFILRKTVVARFSVFDCATRTIIGGAIHSITLTPAATTYCTYSEINNRYYIAFHDLTNNSSMTWIDASNYNNSGSTVVGVHDFIEYIPGSNVIAASRNNTGDNDSRGFALINPVSDTIVYTSPDLWYFQAGSYDVCSGVTVLSIDHSNSPDNASGILCLDNSYNVLNFVPIQNTGTNYEFSYGMAFVETGSRLYITTTNFDRTGSLYSCKISCTTASVITL